MGDSSAPVMDPFGEMLEVSQATSEWDQQTDRTRNHSANTARVANAAAAVPPAEVDSASMRIRESRLKDGSSAALVPSQSQARSHHQRRHQAIKSRKHEHSSLKRIKPEMPAGNATASSRPQSYKSNRQFWCDVEYRATLPEIPLEPKLLKYPYPPDLFSDYRQSGMLNLEMNRHHRIAVESAFPVPLDLMDPAEFDLKRLRDSYLTMKYPGREDEMQNQSEPLDEMDERLLDELDIVDDCLMALKLSKDKHSKNAGASAATSTRIDPSIKLSDLNKDLDRVLGIQQGLDEIMQREAEDYLTLFPDAAERIHRQKFGDSMESSVSSDPRIKKEENDSMDAIPPFLNRPTYTQKAVHRPGATQSRSVPSNDQAFESKSAGSAFKQYDSAIRKSFEDVKVLKHPRKPGLTAVQYYDIFPDNGLSDARYKQFVFPHNPLTGLVKQNASIKSLSQRMLIESGLVDNVDEIEDGTGNPINPHVSAEDKKRRLELAKRAMDYSVIHATINPNASTFDSTRTKVKIRGKDASSVKGSPLKRSKHGKRTGIRDGSSDESDSDSDNNSDNEGNQNSLDMIYPLSDAEGQTGDFFSDDGVDDTAEYHQSNTSDDSDDDSDDVGLLSSSNTHRKPSISSQRRKKAKGPANQTSADKEAYWYSSFVPKSADPSHGQYEWAAEYGPMVKSREPSDFVLVLTEEYGLLGKMDEKIKLRHRQIDPQVSEAGMLDYFARLPSELKMPKRDLRQPKPVAALDSSLDEHTQIHDDDDVEMDELFGDEQNAHNDADPTDGGTAEKSPSMDVDDDLF